MYAVSVKKFTNNYVIEARYRSTATQLRNKTETCSESTIVRLWQVLKQWFTESTKICFRLQDCLQVVCSLLDILSVGLEVQFRHLPQLGGPQFLEGVVAEDANECCKCYGDRGVPNCKLASSRVVDMVGSPNQDDQVQSK